VSPTKQARDGCGKEPKLHQVTEMEKKNLERNQVQSGCQFSSGQRMNEQGVIMIQTASEIRIWIGSIQIQFILL